MKFIIKKWMYEKAQASAGKYNFTLVWARMAEKEVNEKDIQMLKDCGIDNEKINSKLGKKYYVEDKNNAYNQNIFSVYGEVINETEKAVLLSLNYWNLNKAGRYVTDAPMCKGFKVWMPKEAIINGLN